MVNRERAETAIIEYFSTHKEDKHLQHGNTSMAIMPFAFAVEAAIAHSLGHGDAVSYRRLLAILHNYLGFRQQLDLASAFAEMREAMLPFARALEPTLRRVLEILIKAEVVKKVGTGPFERSSFGFSEKMEK